MEGYSGSRVVSPTVNADGARNLVLDYWVRAGDDAFSEDVDNGEDLDLQYKDSNGNWNTLQTFAGGNEGNIWDSSVALPSAAAHSGLQIRFRHTGGSGNNYDYWHVDDVRLRGERYVGSGSPPGGSTGGTQTLLNANFENGRDGFSTYRHAGRGSQTANSGSYSLYTRYDGGSRVVSPTMDGSGASDITLQYWVRKGDDSFSEDPDTSSEDLTVQYRDAGGSWNTVERYDGGSMGDGNTDAATISLPSDAYHSNLQVRFRQTGGSGSPNDYWHIDDVVVTKTE
jgi:hypothetical protein